MLMDLVVSLTAELSRRPVPEAAPGGLKEAAENLLRRCSALGLNAGYAKNELVALQEAVDACPTPAPNREAELKVIEAAKDIAAEHDKIERAFSNRPGMPQGKCQCRICKLVASLAQSEMKGETR